MTITTAQQQITDYALQHTSAANVQQFLATAMGAEGVAFDRQPGRLTVCHIVRTGRTITVTETVVTETDAMVNGRLMRGEPTRETNEIMTVEL